MPTPDAARERDVKAAWCLMFGWLLACDAAPDPCDACARDERCVADACEAVCMPPQLPRFGMVPLGLELAVPDGVELVVDAVTCERVVFDRIGDVAVQVQWRELPAACDAAPVFDAVYHVVDQLPAATMFDGADAVALDDARIVAWASGYVRPRFGADLDDVWRKVGPALGPATGRWDDAVSLGNGGAMTFTFDVLLSDGPGLDLAVFENGFSAAFLELAFVEVSSDGKHFARFPSVSLQTEPVGPYGAIDASEVLGVAGRYAGGYGTGFDLADLVDTDMVLTGRVDLGDIQFVRVVDIVGDASAHDVRGQPFFDPTPTFGPAGFDVEAIAVLGAP